MAKRFQDNEEWKTHFVRGLQGPYKAFWFFLKSACDHGGIWEIDIDEARMRTGFYDLDKDQAEQLFDKKILKLPCGEKWFLLDFCFEQYNTNVLDPYRNTAHRGVVKILHRYKLIDNNFNVLREQNIAPLKPLPITFKGNKDMYKDKDLNMDNEIVILKGESEKKITDSAKPKTKAVPKAKSFVTPLSEAFSAFREMRSKIRKPLTERAIGMIHTELTKLAGDDEELKIAILNQSTVNGWADVYKLKDKNAPANGQQSTAAASSSKTDNIINLATSAQFKQG